MLKEVTKNLLLVFAALVLSALSSVLIGRFYVSLFPGTVGTSPIGTPDLVTLVSGFINGLLLFIPILVLPWGNKKVLPWLLVLPVLFELAADLQRFYFPLGFGLVGFAIGWGIRKFLLKK